MDSEGDDDPPSWRAVPCRDGRRLLLPLPPFIPSIHSEDGAPMLALVAVAYTFPHSERGRETYLHVSVLFMAAREDILLSMHDLFDCVFRNEIICLEWAKFVAERAFESKVL